MGKVKIDLNKAKNIAHEKRRAMRAEEFDPLDAEIAKQIPGTDFEAVENKRRAIRDKYDRKQKSIDNSTTVEALKEALKE